MKKLSETFASFEEGEMRAILGGNAVEVYGFDPERLAPVVAEIGPRNTATRIATTTPTMPMVVYWRFR